MQIETNNESVVVTFLAVAAILPSVIGVWAIGLQAWMLMLSFCIFGIGLGYAIALFRKVSLSGWALLFMALGGLLNSYAGMPLASGHAAIASGLSIAAYVVFGIAAIGVPVTMYRNRKKVA